jgi:hypothetical protein
MQVLNFYSTIFADQLKRGRKTATIRLGDKSHKYRKNQAVLVTIGYQHSPREKIFEAVIDQVEVKRVKDLSPRDIEHDNPEFRRHEEMIHFLEQIYGKKVSVDDIVTVVRFSQIIENPPEVTNRLHGVGGAQNERYRGGGTDPATGAGVAVTGAARPGLSASRPPIAISTHPVRQAQAPQRTST